MNTSRAVTSFNVVLMALMLGLAGCKAHGSARAGSDFDHDKHSSKSSGSERHRHRETGSSSSALSTSEHGEDGSPEGPAAHTDESPATGADHADHDHDRGHGNDDDGVDEDNPGKGK